MCMYGLTYRVFPQCKRNTENRLYGRFLKMTGQAPAPHHITVKNIYPCPRVQPDPELNPAATAATCPDPSPFPADDEAELLATGLFTHHRGECPACVAMARAELEACFQTVVKWQDVALRQDETNDAEAEAEAEAAEASGGGKATVKKPRTTKRKNKKKDKK